MASEVQPTNYRIFCHTCKESDQEAKITHCVKCCLYAFCEKHQGAKHRCLEAPKGTGSGLNLNKLLEGFRQSSVTGEDTKAVRITRRRIEKMNPEAAITKPEKRLREVARYYLGDGDLAIWFDKDGSIAGSQIVIMRKVQKVISQQPQPSQKLSLPPLRRRKVKERPLLCGLNAFFDTVVQQIAHEAAQKLAAVLMEQQPALTGHQAVKQEPAQERPQSLVPKFEPLLAITYPEPAQAALTFLLEPRAIEPLKLPIVIELPESTKEEPPHEPADKNPSSEQPQSLAPATTQSPYDPTLERLEKVKEKLQLLENHESDEDLGYTVLREVVTPGRRAKLDLDAKWTYTDCVHCAKPDAISHCGLCSLYVHADCLHNHNTIYHDRKNSVAIKNSKLLEGGDPGWKEIANYLVTEVKALPKGAEILHAKVEDTLWHFQSKGSWEEQKKGHFAERVLSVLDHVNRSLKGGLVVAIEGDELDKCRVVILTPNQSEWLLVDVVD